MHSREYACTPGFIQHIFNVYTDSVIREAYNDELGIKTSGKLAYNLRNADDIAIYSRQKIVY